jgi:tRNA1Val (adenine37-N6)-methyltransferase
MNLPTISEDTILNGRIRLLQFRSGYRFSIDAILLSAFIQPGTDETIVDMGTGCGIIPLILTFRNPGVTVIGIEIQTELAEMAQKNVMLNELENRIAIRCQDLKTVNRQNLKSPVDRVVSNPPYRKINSGRINPADQKAVARHELSTNLKDIIRTTTGLLNKGGRLDMIYSAERLTDVLTEMRFHGIEPKQIRMVHSRMNTSSRLFLVSGVSGGNPGGIDVLPPLYIYEANGRYSDDVSAMLSPVLRNDGLA